MMNTLTFTTGINGNILLKSYEEMREKHIILWISFSTGFVDSNET